MDPIGCKTSVGLGDDDIDVKKNNSNMLKRDGLCEEDRRSSPLDGVLQPEPCNSCLSAPTRQKSHLCCCWE